MCINAATLALVDAGTPLAGVLVATTVFLDADGQVAADADVAGSRHVLGFAKSGRCVFAESLGEFDEAAFARAVEAGRSGCAIGKPDEGAMEVEGAETVGLVVRRAIENKVKTDMRWSEL